MFFSIGVQEGLLFGGNTMFPFGAQPFHVHPAQVNKQVSSRGVLLVSNLLPRKLKEVIASLLHTPDSQVGVHALSDAGMPPATPGALFLYGHTSSVKYLFVRFMVQQDGSKLKLLLESPQIAKQDAHFVTVLVYQMIVTKGVYYQNIRLLSYQEFLQVVKRLAFVGSRMQQNRVVSTTDYLESIPQRYANTPGNKELFKTLVASLWAYFVIEVENFAGTVYRKVRLAFLAVPLSHRTEQRLLQDKAETDVKSQNAFTALGLPGNQPGATLRKETVTYDTGNWQGCIGGKLINSKKWQETSTNRRRHPFVVECRPQGSTLTSYTSITTHKNLSSVLETQPPPFRVAVDNARGFHPQSCHIAPCPGCRPEFHRARGLQAVQQI